MKGHTNKHQITTLHNDHATATLYSSGGELHTVEIVRFVGDTGSTTTERRSFRGVRACARAQDYMRQAISHPPTSTRG